MSRSEIKFHAPLAAGSKATSNRKGIASSWEVSRLPYCHQIHKNRNEMQLLRHELRILKKAPFPAKRCGKTLLNIPSNMLVVKA